MIIRPLKIRTRIIIGFLFIVIISLFYLTSWILNDLRPEYLKSMEESLIDTATVLSTAVSLKAQNNQILTNDLHDIFNTAYTREFSAKIYDLEKKRININVYVTDVKGIVLYDSKYKDNEGNDLSRWNDVYKTLKGRYGARSSPNRENPKTSTLFIASPIISNKKIIGVLTVYKAADSVDLFVRHARNKIIIAAIIAGILLVGLSVTLSTWVTWPIKLLTNYARAIRDGKRVRLPKLSKGEIQNMGKALEEMRDALEGKKYVEQYIQTLTHEIKNPLAGIRGASELLEEEMPGEKRKKFVKNIHAESNRIQGIVDRMLQLSSLETRKGLEDIEDINISAMLSDIIEAMSPLFDAKNIEIKQLFSENAHIQGERFLIRQAVINLIQNAYEFTPVNGLITISLEKQSQHLNLIIEDTGPGIPDYAYDKIFERFYSLRRPDTQRKSTGLGLSFVREVVSLHNGTITVNNTAKTKSGTKAMLRLPFSLTIISHINIK